MPPALLTPVPSAALAAPQPEALAFVGEDLCPALGVLPLAVRDRALTVASPTPPTQHPRRRLGAFVVRETRDRLPDRRP